eukprot:CAMPEP_0204005568 /NCGR_PEP_ID=MMETSP0360-20130528/19189_1 /ASSEMBLY_ACC=CAM_ASM_000342 /TAXON_ID=268821 /ORGANISM="Scrippsiella Hangoei, Strain SHTV-5" /LENGTH=164 /DNA_ID=CAMNT_0050947575 /DNA_START=209 /DNA_END=703 /DNA_ORIENTATION=-
MSETSANVALTLAMDALVLFCATRMTSVRFAVLFKLAFANLADKLVSWAINFEASTLVLSSSKPTFIVVASKRSDRTLAKVRLMTPSIICRRSRIAVCPNSIVRRVSAIRSGSVWSNFPESSAPTCFGDQASNQRATMSSARGTPAVPRPAFATKSTVCLTEEE